MKFNMTLKTPDAAEHALVDCPEEERDEALALIAKYIRYNEICTLQFDTEEDTCIVLEQQ